MEGCQKGFFILLFFLSKPFFCRIALQVDAVVVRSCPKASFVLNEISMDFFIYSHTFRSSAFPPPRWYLH